MDFNTIEEAIRELQEGRIIIVVDDEDRENEGDFVMAAERVTPEAVNFMARHGRGLIAALKQHHQVRVEDSSAGSVGALGHLFSERFEFLPGLNRSRLELSQFFVEGSRGPAWDVKLHGTVTKGRANSDAFRRGNSLETSLTHNSVSPVNS